MTTPLERSNQKPAYPSNQIPAPVRSLRRRVEAIRNVGAEALPHRLSEFWSWLHQTSAFDASLEYLSVDESSEEAAREARRLCEQHPDLLHETDNGLDQDVDRRRVLYQGLKLAAEAENAFVAEYFAANLGGLDHVSDVSHTFCDLVLEPLALFIEEATRSLLEIRSAIRDFERCFEITESSKPRDVHEEVVQFLEDRGIVFGVPDDSQRWELPHPRVAGDLFAPISVFNREKMGSVRRLNATADEPPDTSRVLQWFWVGLNLTEDDIRGQASLERQPYTYLEFGWESSESTGSKLSEAAASIGQLLSPGDSDGGETSEESEDRSAHEDDTESAPVSVEADGGQADYSASKEEGGESSEPEEGGEDDNLTYELPTFEGEPSNHGEGWSVVQKNELVHRVLEQEPLETVCRDLGRSAQSVRLKLLQVKTEDRQPLDEDVAEYLAKFPVEEAEYNDWISVEDDVLEAGLVADLSAEELVAHIGRPAADIRQRIESLADGEGAKKEEPEPELSEDELWEEALEYDSLAQLSDRLVEAPETTRQKLVTLKVRREEFFNSQLTSLFRDALQMQLETSEWTDAEEKLLEEGERVGLSARAWSMHLGRSPDEIREYLSEAEDQDNPTSEETSGNDDEPEEADDEKEPETIGDWSGGEEGALYGAVGQNKTTIPEVCGRFHRSGEEIRLKLLELKCRRGKHLDDDLSDFLLEYPGSDHLSEEWTHWEDEVLTVAFTRGREIPEIVPHIGRGKPEIAERVEELDNIDDHRLDELVEEPPDNEPDREFVEDADELDNVGEPWTKQEEKQLYEKARDGMALRELQGIFQRHVETIRKKLIARKVAKEAYFDEHLTHVFERTAELECATEKWKKAEEDLLKRGIESGVVLEELVHHLGRSKRDIYYRASDWSPIEVRNLKNWIIDNSIFDEKAEVDTSEPVSEASEDIDTGSAQAQTYDPDKSLRSLVAEILSDAQVPLQRDDVVERLPEGLSYSKTTVRTYLSSEDYSIRVGRGEYFHRKNYPVREFQQRKLVNFVVEHLLTDGKTISCVQLVEPLKESELSSPRTFAEHEHAPKLLWGLLAEDDRVRTGPHLLVRKGDGNTEDLIQPAIYEALKKVGPATPAEVDAEIDKRFGFDYPDDRVESALRDLATKGDAERLPNGLYYPINVEKAVFNLFQSKSSRILECALQTSPEKFSDHQLWLVAKTLKGTGNGVQARRFVEELEARDSEYTERPDWEEVHNVVPDEDLSEVSDSLVDDLLGAAD